MPWTPAHPISNGMKICIECKKEKYLEEFSKQKKCKEGVRPECKVCLREKSKIYYKKNQKKITEKGRAYGKTDYRKKYCRDRARIKLKEKREREASRPRPKTCECCFELPDKRGVVWDHNHSTGKFRGWLCNRCNRVLGMCIDSKEIFWKMIKYLQNNQE
jgi:hypothetical protein